MGETGAGRWGVAWCASVAMLGCVEDPAGRASLVTWRSVDSVNAELPEGVRLFEGVGDALPLRAWYVLIDEAHPAVTTRVELSDDPIDRRETVSSFASDAEACVAVNGGYFRMDLTPASHVGLLLTDGVMIASATSAVIREDVRYPTARAAIGFAEDGAIDIAWVSTVDDTAVAWPDPFLNAPGRPATPASRRPTVWGIRDAVAAGPALVMEGTARVTADEEVFFGSSIPDVHPRTAAGRTADGKLVLMVVDGRQPRSRGVDLDQLASLMLQAGAVEALNLDGGGSSTLVVAGRLINRPTGGATEREVMSALVTRCTEDR